jgi:hypothetical protein
VNAQEKPHENAPVVIPHNCDDHAEYREWDGPIGHGWACAVCDALLQVG